MIDELRESSLHCRRSFWYWVVM